MISKLFGEFVKLPTSDEEWISEFKRFIENNEFDCVAACNGFHKHIFTN